MARVSTRTFPGYGISARGQLRIALGSRIRLIRRLRQLLRCLLWRQWKRVFTRARTPIRLGLTEERSWRSAVNGRGPWWNAGASHMHQVLPKRRFDRMGLVSVLDTVHRLQRLS